METIEQQLANKCKHFTGMHEETCKAGIKYVSVKVKTNISTTLPCFKNGRFSGGTCNHVCFPTLEEVNKMAKEILSDGEKVIIAIAAVKGHIKKTGLPQGEIDCPSCNGVLEYKMSINGHTMGRCNCGISWME